MRKSERSFPLSWPYPQEGFRLNSKMQVKFMNDIRIEELCKFATEFVAAEPDRSSSDGYWQEPLLVSALSADAFERHTCWNRLNENRMAMEYFSDLPESTHVCGKCAALMPCSFLNPVAKL